MNGVHDMGGMHGMGPKIRSQSRTSPCSARSGNGASWGAVPARAGRPAAAVSGGTSASSSNRFRPLRSLRMPSYERWFTRCSSTGLLRSGYVTSGGLDEQATADPSARKPAAAAGAATRFRCHSRRVPAPSLPVRAPLSRGAAGARAPTSTRQVTRASHATCAASRARHSAITACGQIAGHGRSRRTASADRSTCTPCGSRRASSGGPAASPRDYVYSWTSGKTTSSAPEAPSTGGRLDALPSLPREAGERSAQNHGRRRPSRSPSVCRATAISLGRDRQLSATAGELAAALQPR